MNKIIFAVDVDEEGSSSPTYIALSFIVVFYAVMLQTFGSVTPGFG
jgi:hypothetical protein